MAIYNSFIKNIVDSRAEGNVPVIAEIKAFTPRDGYLLRGRDIVDIARDYQAGDAACISVVTGKWYHGSLRDLERIAASVELPILRKDLITNDEQIRISREMGASAVLLTSKILGMDHLAEMVQYCMSLQLVPFVEVSSREEIRECLLGPGSVLAINNRDIRVKESDDGTICRSMQLVEEGKQSGATLIVSASGIETIEEAAQLIEAGFDALLIGTSLLLSDQVKYTVELFTTARKNTIMDGAAHGCS